MIWGAHKADGRIAAKNSVKIRAAIRRSIDARQIFEDYQHTHPFVTDNNVQDRTRARAWAMLHVQVDTATIKAAIIKTWADGFVLGIDSANEAVAKARLATKAEDVYVDWVNWKPGNRAAALILRPTGAFQALLAKANITSDAIAKVGYDRIGTALADSIAAGFSPQKAARVMLEKVGDPARALTIAITEQNRAISIATIERYQDYGLEKVEWSGANPCDICAPNEGQIVNLGDSFNSGDSEPPVHPNCRCALLPVIAGMEDDPSLGQDYLDTLMLS
jgi:SPP1 gp7 family putative phage head morphogenesis protein